MRRWFLAQPIHRKLVLISFAKTTAVLALAITAMLAFDIWRFQGNATSTASALGSIVAENIRASLVLEDTIAVNETLTTTRLQTSMQRACAYRLNGTLFAEYVRDLTRPCPLEPPKGIPWTTLAALVPVEQNGAVVGSVYFELSWSAMKTRLITAAVASLVVLILATVLMGYLSHRLYRGVSAPIAELATAARQLGQESDPKLPSLDSAQQDEVSDLIKAFHDMADRVRTANHFLSEANESLRREIDERRAIEVEREGLLVREREANRVKDEFLAIVSHELRTPLNAIVGWARILVSTNPDKATIEKAAASLHRNALAQARVIDDLIDISRIVTGKLAVRSEPVDLRIVVESAVEATRPAASRAGVTFTVRIPSTPCIVVGDRDRLSQVVVNLLSNAVKFAPRSVVKVTLTPEGTSLLLSVADTGVGIPAEFLTHVFDRFRQADASSTRDHGGLGIGLTIAKELVELHGGSIRAESDGRGLGATFTVTLPLSPHQVLTDHTDFAPPLLTDVSILAVDDNPDALELLEAALNQAGATVRVASSGAEALELWEAQPSDVLLCDLAMPRMSGFELLAVIREIDRKKGRLTPAIAVTAHATEEQVARSAQAGFQVHVAKPFDANRLIHAVNVARTKV